MIVAIAGSVAAAGAGLVAFGVRGRRVNDHPICRRCGFDLVGLAGRVAACPECGSELGARRAVRRGARRRRPAAIVLGGLLLLGGIGVGAVGASGVDLTRHKPVWWLIAVDLRREDQSALEVAAAELRRRLADGEAEAARVLPAAERILVRQLDGFRAWSPELGDLFEDLWIAGVVSDEQTVRYMAQSLTPTLRMHRPFEPSSVRYALGWSRVRIGSSVRRVVPFTITVERCVLVTPEGERELSLPRGGTRVCVYKASGSDWTIEDSSGSDIPAGTFPLSITVRLRCDAGVPVTPPPGMIGYFSHPHPDLAPARSGDGEVGETGAAFAEWTVEFRPEAEIRADTLRVFELTTAPEHRQAVEAAVVLADFRAIPRGERTVFGAELHVRQTAVALEHEIFLRQGDRETRLEPLSLVMHPAPKRDPVPTVTANYPVHGVLALRPGRFQIVLKPKPSTRTWGSYAERDDGPVQIWGEEIVLEGEIPAWPE